MSFRPFLVEDSRINDITKNLDFAVFRGAGSNTFQTYTSQSSSGSSISFNIQTPSENTVISREVMIETTVKFSIEIDNVDSSKVAFSYGLNDSFSAFPFSSLISSAAVTINNTTISTNLQDTRDLILKNIPQAELSKYQGGTPSMLDSFYKYYSDGGYNSELNGYVQSSYNKYLEPRGCHKLDSYIVEHYINGVYTDDSIISTGLTDSWRIIIEATFTEPLMCSPFIFGSPTIGSEQGLYGVTNIEVVLNIDGTLKRFWSTKSANYNYKIELDPQEPFKSNMLLNYLTPQADEIISAKNSIPYLLYPRYITPYTNNAIINPGQTSIISTQNIILSKIPDLLLICARKAISTQTIYDSASFYPITNVSINFNNQSALLSNASQQDLYKLSIRNGIDQSWNEFSGSASTYDFLNTTGEPNIISTVGPVLCINPAYDLSLGPTLANSSIGSFNLQCNITVRNNGRDPIAPEICIIAVTAGIFTTEAGNSSINTGMLTSSIVVEATKSDRVSRSFMQRKIGSGLFSSLGSFMKTITQKKTKQLEEMPVKKKLSSFIKN